MADLINREFGPLSPYEVRRRICMDYLSGGSCWGIAAKLSAARGYCNQETMRRMVDLLKHAGLPVEAPKELRSHLVLAIESDKKIANGKVKFVCVEELGRTRFEYLTSKEIAELAAP